MRDGCGACQNLHVVARASCPALTAALSISTMTRMRRPHAALQDCRWSWAATRSILACRALQSISVLSIQCHAHLRSAMPTGGMHSLTS